MLHEFKHGTSSWGYTILRTAYTRESDELFPIALERLMNQVHYWCHYTRFPAFGLVCAENRVDFDEPNKELLRRFYLEVVEDREGLGHLDSGSDDARFVALGDYFRRWVEGAEKAGHPEDSPRFIVCLVLDSASIASLAELPEELPPLRCAANLEEKRESLGAGGGGWVWLLETDYMADPELHNPGDGYRGWMRMEVSDIENSWFRRLTRGTATYITHEEREPGSGIYWFAEE
jgi:hypothetical protein